MTLPAPPPEKGTRIVFVGSTRDELLTVDVEENARGGAVGQDFAAHEGRRPACLGEPRERALRGERQAGGLKRETGRRYLDMRPRPKKPRTANTMTMMRIQSHIDTVILSLGSAPTLRRVNPYLQGCSAYAFLPGKRRVPDLQGKHTVRGWLRPHSGRTTTAGFCETHLTLPHCAVH
jgi:hypothetical protein